MDVTIPMDFNSLAGGYIAKTVLTMVILQERESGHRWFSYKKLYDYAIVCRQWFNIIAPLMYERAIIYCTTTKLDEPEKVPNRSYHWYSNLGQIVRAGMQDQVREFRLDCEQFSRVFTDCPDLFGKLGMPDTPFVNVFRLWFGGTCHYGAGLEDLFVVPTTRYFIKMFPNTTVVANNRFFDRGKYFDKVIDRLQHHFHNQLSNYRIDVEIPRRHPTFFPPNITKLSVQAELLMSSHLREEFPKVPIAGLRILYLRNIRTTFKWHIFKSSVPGEIQFTNLEYLHISTDYHQTPISIFPDHDLITFPKLKRLQTTNSMQAYHDIFKLFVLSPLEFVDLSERVHQFKLIEPAVLQSVKRIIVHPMFEYNENTEEALQGLMPVFDSPSAATHAEIRMSLRGTRMPYSLAWNRLRRLIMAVDKFIISEAENIISYLPLLQYLSVTYDPPQYDVPMRLARIDEKECPPDDPNRVIHPSLQMFEIVTTYDWMNEGDRDRIKYFVKHIPTLIKLNIPPKYGRVLVAEFAKEGREIELHRRVREDTRFSQFIDPINI
ncbi:hypothetical protein FBU59_000189 [Linderina macrospora]|uniref:Uncharacterized protein n=1 Tax=Linderina macrospora TaxID=4868 RepID=A0ACC1JHW8_9FUNG|nr:hypothetical protein FBU59_000189 [Linderina macrospora]